jgi:DNA-directed RNA polymerase specialized sigma24 family protein
MPTTHLSLVAGLREEAPDAWERFDAVYRPWLRDWVACRLGFHPDDADEVVQQVMLAVMQEFRRQRDGLRPPFEHQGRGSFRSWLHGITHHRALALLRSERLRRPVPNGEEVLRQASTHDSSLGRLWDQEHEAKAIQHAWEAIRHEFKEQVWRPVGELLFADRPTRQVAEEFGVALRTLFNYQKTIKDRLKELLAGMLD